MEARRYEGSLERTDDENAFEEYHEQSSRAVGWGLVWTSLLADSIRIDSPC